mgnify:CR=1 FL=1
MCFIILLCVARMNETIIMNFILYLAICTQCLKFHKDKMANEAIWVDSAEIIQQPTRVSKRTGVTQQGPYSVDTTEK